MEFVLVVLVIGAVAFVLVMLGFFFGKLRGKRQEAAFQQYVAQQFPDLPAPAELLLASHESKGKPDTALVVADERQEIIVLSDRGREGMTHLAVPFSAVSSVDSASRIISRGLPTSRTYSYEQTMTVTLADGRAIPFTLEFLSNKHGSDKAPALVADLFAPWEKKLNGIRRGHDRARVPSPEPSPTTATTGPTDSVASAPGQPAPTPAAAVWGPDPFRRFEYRYFDGSQWTDQVSISGQVRTDPPVPTASAGPAQH